ncbi:hypothetical protein GDO81_028923 [Engystomops pustulosus]|uniref:Uncharacterized protein n=1 Tax=Engystomops pustulosus TaxID=76066 RepID=A0AAV6YX47_ENGPU|nr:hypothetical protein GDO81_028923 [Engystomops pustulosus]
MLLSPSDGTGWALPAPGFNVGFHVHPVETLPEGSLSLLSAKVSVLVVVHIQHYLGIPPGDHDLIQLVVGNGIQSSPFCIPRVFL